MAGLAFLLFFIVLGTVGIAASSFLSTRPWPSSRRFLSVAAVWLSLLAIPFWDLIPAKLHLRELCKNAGVEMLSTAGNGLRFSDDFDVANTEQQHGWGVIGTTELVRRKDNGAPVAILKSYHLTDGNKGFLKPWLSGECPTTAAVAAGQTTAWDVARNQLRKKLLESK